MATKLGFFFNEEEAFVMAVSLMIATGLMSDEPEVNAIALAMIEGLRTNEKMQQVAPYERFDDLHDRFNLAVMKHFPNALASATITGAKPYFDAKDKGSHN